MLGLMALALHTAALNVPSVGRYPNKGLIA
jgi:hypothetical protein